MKEAVIVSTARTPIGKAYRGGFNNLQAPQWVLMPFALLSSARVSKVIA